MIETWRDVPGYEGLYEISDLGHLRRSDGKLLRGSPNTKGYWRYTLTKDGLPKSFSGHSLVLAAFVGPRPDGLAIDHINGVRDDNRLPNLRYCTAHENAANMIERGTQVEGERHHAAKLTFDQAVEAVRQRMQGRTCLAIAKDFGVRPETVSRLSRGENWPEAYEAALRLEENATQKALRAAVDALERIVSMEGTLGPHGLAAIARAALKASPTTESNPAGRETAWLIEFPEVGDTFEGGKRVGPARPVEWLAGIPWRERWKSRTNDPSKAIRFARKADAEAAMLMMQLAGTAAFASEHIWLATEPNPAGMQVAETIKWLRELAESCKATATQLYRSSVNDEAAETWRVRGESYAFIADQIERGYSPLTDTPNSNPKVGEGVADLVESDAWDLLAMVLFTDPGPKHIAAIRHATEQWHKYDTALLSGEQA